MASYAIGFGLLATSRFGPAVLELSIWGVEKLGQGLYWAAWGRHASADQEKRLRDIIREELSSERLAESRSEAHKHVVDDRRRKSW